MDKITEYLKQRKIAQETGIYEIDLEDRGFIHSISFLDSSDVNSPFKKYQKGSQLLIDIVYEGTVNNQ